MSTKFSHISGHQGPPPICRKPPDEPISPPPPLPETIPEIFTETHLPLFTPPVNIITYLSAEPVDASIAWFGLSTTYPDHVEVSLVLNPTALTLDITVTTKRFANILNIITFWNVPLISPLRLQTRKVYARHPVSNNFHQLQVFQ